MKGLLAACAALLIEALAFAGLMQQWLADEQLALLLFWLVHGLASVLAAEAAWLITPSRWRVGRYRLRGLYFSFAFFIPVLGIAGLLLVLFVAVRYPKTVSTDQYAQIREPQYLMTMRESQERSDIRAANARQILRDAKESVDNKLRVMLALQHMRPKVSVPLLQELLSDPVEDLRLLAYSMLDSWEKDLAQRIGQTQQALAAARARQSQREIINSHQRLAELYWEQVDTGLARGDLRTFALEQAKVQCEQALTLEPKLSGLWLHYGRVLLDLGNVAAAEKAFRLARKAGMSELYVMPELARIAWELGRPGDVSAFLRRISQQAHLPQGLHQVVRFWAPETERPTRP